ncbi:MAG: nucleotidyltransferase family protein [Cyanobium sp.]|jgi:predicted nucleotidyltransferase
MPLTAAQRQHWRQLWARESDALEERRQQLLVVAKAVAKELQGLWPEVGVRLFGSVLGPGFHDGSDLDLAVEGLPREALLEALALAERCADAQLLTLGGSPVAVDLVRLEALPVPWQERIRQRGQALP